MSDILIKDIEMPEYCYEDSGHGIKPCAFLDVCKNKWETNINAVNVHSEACPLVEVPTHGDLISKQETVKKLMDAMCKGCKHTDDCGWCAMAEYRRIVEDAPTIIEAST